MKISTLLPTVLTLLSEKISEAAMFYGILSAILIGLPVFAYGKFTGELFWILSGSIFTVLHPGIVIAVVAVKEKTYGMVGVETK